MTPKPDTSAAEVLRLIFKLTSMHDEGEGDENLPTACDVMAALLVDRGKWQRMAEDIGKRMTGVERERDELRAKAESEGGVVVSLKTELGGLDALIARMRAQDVAAIRQWQAAHPGNDLLWPDQMRLTAWCMGEVAKAHAERDAAQAMLAEALPQATHDSGWGDYDASTVTGPRPPSLQALEQRVAAIEERMRNR